MREANCETEFAPTREKSLHLHFALAQRKTNAEISGQLIEKDLQIRQLTSNNAINKVPDEERRRIFVSVSGDDPIYVHGKQNRAKWITLWNTIGLNGAGICQ